MTRKAPLSAFVAYKVRKFRIARRRTTNLVKKNQRQSREHGPRRTRMGNGRASRRQ